MSLEEFEKIVQKDLEKGCAIFKTSLETS